MSRFAICALTMLALAGFGCGDDDSNAGAGGASGSSGTGGSSGNGGTGGDPGICTGASTDDPNCVNQNCPDTAPATGPRAQKGACCFRVSNATRAKTAWDAGETATLEFRQNALATSTQPTTVGNGIIQASLADTYAKDWSNTLVRVEGVPKSGKADVIVTIGAGRSNCDGTYSFFGDGAAADQFGRTDDGRWKPAVMNGEWDWDTDEKLTIAAEERAAGVRWAPVAYDYGVFGYEQPTQDLDYKFTFAGTSSTDVDDNALNCVGGEITAPTTWTSTLVQTVFFPIASLKEAEVHSQAVTQNFCSFMGVKFGSDKTCDEVPRVAPDTCEDPESQVGECQHWFELPFGMCDDEHCYVGKEGHPLATCGATAKPCCDPTGVDDSMPACNAFLIEATAVLGAAEIKDELFTDGAKPFPDCF